MTVSSTPCCIKPDPITRLLRVAATLLLAAGLLLTAPVQAEDIRIKSVALDAVDEGYQFNADVEITLNPMLERALERGIVLYFVSELNLLSPRWYWLDEKVARSKQREALSYYALTRQYRLSRGSLSQNFSTLKGALQALGRLRNRPIVENSELSQEAEYIAELRVWLDLSRLPKPFQVEALSSKEWNLSSDTLQWNVRLPAQKPQHGGKP
ncbi:MAG: DUF4390 domain-containing protein [Nitrosospira sp.]|nr:DUF4390 domain-containing protein [Nitrosospira sp.]